LDGLIEGFGREDTLIKWATATFFGGALNAAVLILVLTMWQPIIGSVFHLLAVAVLAFTLPILYSSLASQMLPQKRFVSPFDIVVTSAATILLRSMVLVGYFPYSIYAGDIFLTVVGTIYLVMLGALSGPVAKSMVGIGYSPPHQRTMKTLMSFQDLTTIVEENSSLLKALELEQKSRLKRGKVIIYMNDRSDYRLFVVLVSDAKNKCCLIHFEAYGIGRYAIYTNDRTKKTFERDTSFLEKVLREDEVFLTEYAPKELPFGSEIDQILLRPIRSRLASFTELPNRTKAVVVATSLLILTIFILRVTNVLSQDNFVTTILTVIGPLLIGLLRSLKGPIRRE